MSSAVATNKAAFSRLHEAMNSRDPDVIAKIIDEVIEPDVVIQTPLPLDTTGAEAFKQVWATRQLGYSSNG